MYVRPPFRRQFYWQVRRFAIIPTSTLLLNTCVNDHRLDHPRREHSRGAAPAARRATANCKASRRRFRPQGSEGRGTCGSDASSAQFHVFHAGRRFLRAESAALRLLHSSCGCYAKRSCCVRSTISAAPRIRYANKTDGAHSSHYARWHDVLASAIANADAHFVEGEVSLPERPGYEFIGTPAGGVIVHDVDDEYLVGPVVLRDCLYRGAHALRRARYDAPPRRCAAVD